MAIQIQLRRGTAAEWISANPTLAQGEMGLEYDTNKFKIGDGSTTWNSLGYASNGVRSLIGTANEVEVSSASGDVTLSLPSTINASTTGTAASLTTARIIALSGDVSGSVTFDGSASVDISTQIQPDSVALGTDTTGNYVTQVTGSGDGISVSGSGESASVTISNTGVTSISGTSNEIEVSASTGSITLSLPNTINANTTGSAANLTNSRTIALSGDVSGSVTFDGSASVNIATEIQPNSVTLGTDTTGNYVATASAGTGISISGSGSEDAAITISNTGVTSLTGTANQITVSASNGDATLSFPAAVTFPGTVTLNGDPGSALQAATKQYVDAVAEGLHIHASCQTATTASVDLSSPPASIDGVTLIDQMRVLVKNQSTTSQNGIYVYNSASATLTRASDFDSAAEIDGGDFTYVTGGNTYDNTGWVQTEKVTTVGSDPIIFTQFSGAGTYSAGTGLFLDGTVFSNTGVLSLAGTANQVSVSSSAGNITVSLPSSIDVNTTGSAATLTTSRTIELTGDISGSASFNGSANASISSTLANTAVSAASYGSASAVGTFTVDSKGRLTAASNTPIAIAQSAVTNLTTDLAAKAPLASPTFTGTVTIPTLSLTQADTATTATHYMVEIATDGLIRPKTLADVRTEIVTTAAVNSAAATTVGTITSGTWNGSIIGLAYGGTNANITAVNGGIIYSTASAMAVTAAGTAGQILTSNGNSAPTWQAAPSSGLEGFFLAGL